jgi:hypothetical protein
MHSRATFKKRLKKKRAFALKCASHSDVANMSLCTPCQTVVDENPIAVLIRRDENGNNLLCNHCRKTIYVNNKNAENGLHNFTFERPNPIQKEPAQCKSLYPANNFKICAAHSFSGAPIGTMPSVTSLAKSATPALCPFLPRPCSGFDMLGISESVANSSASDVSTIVSDDGWERWYCKLCKSRVWAQPRAFDGKNEPEDWWWCNTCKVQKKQQMFLLKANHIASGRHKNREFKQAKKADRIKQQLESYPKLDRWLGQ